MLLPWQSDSNQASPGHFPSTLVYGCRQLNEGVTGDATWACSNKTMRYLPQGNEDPSTKPADVGCSTCSRDGSWAEALEHCPDLEMRCPSHTEPKHCCRWWPCDKCHIVTDRTCAKCEAGYSDGAPQACNPLVCPTISFGSENNHGSVTFKVAGKTVTESPHFSGSEDTPTTQAVFACDHGYILTNSASDYVAKAGKDTWTCGIAADVSYVGCLERVFPVGTGVH